MKTYFTVFKNAWLGLLEYRSETVIRLLIALISLISMFYLWNDVFAGRTALAGYSKQQIVTYYILVAYIFASLYASLPISTEIQEGTLSTYLLRPVNYLWFHYWQSLARRTFRFIVGLPVIIVLFWFLRDYVYFVKEPAAYAVLLLACWGAINILFLIDLLHGLCEFWFTQVDSWGLMIDNIVMFFAGTMIPLSLLPPYFKAASDWLPFKYTGSFLIDSFMGRINLEQVAIGMLVQTVWTLALSLIVVLVWRKGLRRYEAFGN